MEKLSKEEKELVLYCLLGGVNILSFFEMFSAINTPLFIFYEWSYFVSLVMLASAMPVSGTLKAIKKVRKEKEKRKHEIPDSVV